MPKWCKTVVAVLLLPVCAGAGWALWLVIQASGNADTLWVAALAGAGCWLVIYSLLPKPMWIYVVGHELTHALWTWLLGGKVKKLKASSAWLFGAEVRRLKVTSSGGHVMITKTNFLIALAPYFFPLYAVLLVVVFAAGQWFWDWRRFLVWFHLLLGVAYAFHVTLTWHILKGRQSDISEQGYLFSAVIIFLGNVLLLLMGIPLLAGKLQIGTARSVQLCAGGFLALRRCYAGWYRASAICKSERDAKNPNAESRGPKQQANTPGFGPRISAFFRILGFGSGTLELIRRQCRFAVR